MTTTLEQPGTTRSPDGLAPAAALPAWKPPYRRGSRGRQPLGRGTAGISGITVPFPELAVHPSRDGGGRKPGDVVQETDGGTVTQTTSPLPARVPARRVAGRVAHEPSVPARVLPGRTAGNARAGAPRARPAQKSRADALLPRTDRHDACPRLGPRPERLPLFRAHALKEARRYPHPRECVGRGGACCRGPRRERPPLRIARTRAHASDVPRRVGGASLRSDQRLTHGRDASTHRRF